MPDLSHREGVGPVVHGRGVAIALPDTFPFPIIEESDRLLNAGLLVQSLVKPVAAAIGQHVSRVEIVALVLSQTPTTHLDRGECPGHHAGNIPPTLFPELFGTPLRVRVQRVDLGTRIASDRSCHQIEAGGDDGTPFVLREVEMWIDQQHLAAVHDQSCDVCGKFLRVSQHGQFTRDIEPVVRLVDVLVEDDIRMIRRVPCCQDGVEHGLCSLSAHCIANPALIGWLQPVVVLRIRADELFRRQLQLPDDPLAIQVAEIDVLAASCADQCLPAFPGRVRGNRSSVLESHQIQDEPAPVPGGERLGLDGVRVEHQKSSSSRSSKKPWGQRSMNSPVSSIRSGVALTSPSICSIKTTETWSGLSGGLPSGSSPL